MQLAEVVYNQETSLKKTGSQDCYLLGKTENIDVISPRLSLLKVKVSDACCLLKAHEMLIGVHTEYHLVGRWWTERWVDSCSSCLSTRFPRY